MKAVRVRFQAQMWIDRMINFPSALIEAYEGLKGNAGHPRNVMVVILLRWMEDNLIYWVIFNYICRKNLKIEKRFKVYLAWYKLRINLTLFSTVVSASIFMFLSCRPFVAITTLSTGLVGVEVTSVSWLGQLTVGV